MPNDPNSLHYFDRERLENPYTMAIRTVGDIVQDYDYGKYCLLTDPLGGRQPYRQSPKGPTMNFFGLNERSW